MDNQQGVDGGLRELALFAGAGGGILGGKLLGWRTVCAVEIEPYPACVLAARQNDGSLPVFPIWDDVRTFDGRPWRGRVDVVSGGFPCQDISVAGKGAGLGAERSGLWVQMVRIVREVEPCYVLVENSPALTFRGLGDVLGNLADMGFDARWGVVSAADAGAPHLRKRIWILAYNRQVGLGDEEAGSMLGGWRPFELPVEKVRWGDEPCEAEFQATDDVGAMAHGVARRVDQLAAIGNGQVPAVARLAWKGLGGP